MRFLIFVLVLLGASFTMTRSEPAGRSQSESRTRIIAVPIALDPDDGRTVVGALRYVSGFALGSVDPRFGGISALALTPDGFIALSDGGTAMWLEGRDGATGDRRPSALRLLPLPAGPGTSDKKGDRDSESMAADRDRRVWVAFEFHNSVWRYASGFRRAEAHRRPPEMARWRGNSGAEGMARLEDGRFVVISEGSGNATRPSQLLLFDRDPTDARAKALTASIRLPSGVRVTDVASLGDGRLLTLHRSFSIAQGVAASIGVIDLAAVKPDAVIPPRILATIRPPLNVDNMEALAVERRGGRVRIWVASDDNFSALQRTLLMQFELIEGPRPTMRRKA